MKGIILAAGKGTRLYPSTLVTSKLLLPVYDKPLLYYPLSTLMQANIREIMLITSPMDQEQYKALLGDGSSFGIDLSYEIQPSPKGIAEAFIIGRDFIGDDSCCLILGDNIFYGETLVSKLEKAQHNGAGATIFGYPVKDPKRFGIVEIDASGKAISLEEKPLHPKSNLCVTGLYFYDKKVCGYAESLTPSKRGELEITDINKLYLDAGQLSVNILDESCSWFDAGTADSMLEASTFVQKLEKNTGKLFGVPEAIAYEKGWIDKATLLRRAQEQQSSNYGKYLKDSAD